jgi:hypothetical protein
MDDLKPAADLNDEEARTRFNALLKDLNARNDRMKVSELERDKILAEIKSILATA